MNRLTIPCGRFATDDDAAAKAKRDELRRKLLEGESISLKNDGSATKDNGNNSTISVPPGKLADDDAAVKTAWREELRRKLLAGEMIELKIYGVKIIIAPGKFADDDAAAKAKREELRRKLLEGSTITIGSSTNKEGDSSNGKQGNGSPIVIPDGKLAAQWYETNPQLLAMEKIAMQKAFPNFTMTTLDDGRLAWSGKLNVGVYESKFHQPMEYHVLAIYMSNHPHQQMGSSVRVYPVLPDVQELIDKCGFRPSHLLRDSNEDLYLCTNEADNQKIGNDVTSAASVLGWACKWFLGYELVLTGDLDKDKFNQHGGI